MPKALCKYKDRFRRLPWWHQNVQILNCILICGKSMWIPFRLVVASWHEVSVFEGRIITGITQMGCSIYETLGLYFIPWSTVTYVCTEYGMNENITIVDKLKDDYASLIIWATRDSNNKTTCNTIDSVNYAQASNSPFLIFDVRGERILH